MSSPTTAVTAQQLNTADVLTRDSLLLGGGDGALLYELLKEKPKYVWMLEIDEVVMTACNKYLRSICGDVLERRKGPNYEVSVHMHRKTKLLPLYYCDIFLLFAVL